MRNCRAWLAGALLALAIAGPAAAERDRHVGYYYPKPETIEEWTSRAVTLPDSDRGRRIAFVTALTNELLTKPYPPQFVVFAKGAEAEKMIIVGLYDNGYNTLFRMRALLAELTAVARLSPIFREYNVENIFTFFELLKLLGFKQVTLSDGDEFAHQVKIQ
ncbi:MAG: molybdopterin-guanine dinucleotide biosynthesis protein A [Alphaproteobacteria bacterium]|nr:molybdopterin-guanine dinucleotide biosynthesis protein A [Alphaproteobacteria bacterium]